MNLCLDAPRRRHRALVAFVLFALAFFGMLAVRGLPAVGLAGYVPLASGIACALVAGIFFFSNVRPSEATAIPLAIGASLAWFVFAVHSFPDWEWLVRAGVYGAEGSFPVDPVAVGEPHDLVARIVSLERVTDAVRRYRAELRSVDGETIRAGVIFLRADVRSRYAPGTVLAWRGKLDRPYGWESPSYRAYLLGRGVIAESFVRDARTLGIDRNFLLVFADRARDGIDAILARSYPPDVRPLLAGLLVGDDSALPSDVRTRFANAGLSHILAVSGFNVAVVSMCLLWLVRPFGPIGRVAVAGAGIAFFACVAGAQAPVMRAAVMGLVLVSVAEWSGRRVRGIALLLATGIAVSCFDPLAFVADASFQLSFLSVLGLILLRDPLGRAFRWLPRALAVRESVVLTLSALVACLPVILVDFGRMPFVAPLANLLVAPLIAPLTILGFVHVGLFGAWASGAYALGFVLDLGLRFVLFVADTADRIPFASVAFDPGAAAPAVLAVGTLGLGVLLLRALLGEENGKTVSE